jgi:hypothetical protein
MCIEQKQWDLQMGEINVIKVNLISSLSVIIQEVK